MGIYAEETGHAITNESRFKRSKAEHLSPVTRRENDTGGQTKNGFSQQPLNITPGILDAMKSSLNMFANTAPRESNT